MALVKLFVRLRTLQAEINRIKARSRFVSNATNAGGNPLFTAELTGDGGMVASGELPADEMAAFVTFLAQEEDVP